MPRDQGMEKKTILNIEILRVMAIIAVVLIHMTIPYFYDLKLMNENYTAWVFNNLYNAISRFCVPIFFIISAYLSFNGNSSSKMSTRMMRLVIPYIVWSAVYYIYNGGNDFIDFIKKITTSNTSFHLWFLPPFIGYTLLLPAIKKIVNDEDPNKNYIIILIMTSSIIMPSVIYALNTFYGDYSFLTGFNNFGLSITPLLIYSIAFPLLRRNTSAFNGIALFVFMSVVNLAVSLLVSSSTGKADTFFYGYTTPLVFISSFILFNAIMSIDFSFIGSRMRKVIMAVGDCSFGIYLTHWIVYLVLSNAELTFKGRAIVDPLLNTIIVLLVSFLLVYVIKKVYALRRCV